MVTMNGRELFKSAENLNKQSSNEMPTMHTTQEDGREALLIAP